MNLISQPQIYSVNDSPVTSIIQVLTVAAAGRYVAALSVSVDILAAAQGLLLLVHLAGSLLHGRWLGNLSYV